MKRILPLLICLLPVNVFAQGQPLSNVQKVQGVSVSYKSTYNGKPSQDSFLLTADNRVSCIKVGDEWIYVDYVSSDVINMSILPSGDTISTSSPFKLGAGLEPVGKESVAGWECVKYRTVINSNTIEIWATEDLGFNGTFQPAFGVPRGVVLKTVRNGNTVVQADQITQMTAPSANHLPLSYGRRVDAAEYRHLLNNKDVVTIPVFDNVSLGFNGAKGPASFDNAPSDSIFSVAGGTVVLRKVLLPKDVAGRAIFARVVQRAEKDAYDRTGSVFVIPTDRVQSFLDAMTATSSIKVLPPFVPRSERKSTDIYPGLISTPDYNVPLELMRFFTSFGVGGYNHVRVHGQRWADSVVYRQEVTHFAPYLTGEVWVGTYIGNWVDRGHRLSLSLAYHPSGGRGKDASQSVVVPLFNTVNLLEQAGQTYPVFFDKSKLSVTFNLDRDLNGAQLVYTSTGHGGWGGGDEFNPKLNAIYLDGRLAYSYIPWRDDCASYRSLNPASGNFANGLSSSDLSRSAWCPGTVTNPVYVPLGDMKKGKHTIEVSIPQGAPEGTSFSYWCVSGALVGSMVSK